jgi:predicted MFS family arabinose efflux permease
MNQVAQSLKMEKLIKILSALTFLIFFQAFMVAPLIPKLSVEFNIEPEAMGKIIPAYLLPYGISTLFYGLLSDHFGRRKIMLLSLGSLCLFTALTATAKSHQQVVTWRLLTGVGASGVVPLALALVGASFPMNERGRPLGWLFGAMAGGMAFGSSFGLFLEPFIGWRGLFLGCSASAAFLMGFLIKYQTLLGDAPPSPSLTVKGVFFGYAGLLSQARGARTYIFVFVNAVFHSGLYTWLGLYFSERFKLGEFGIGLALLGYGIPGFVLGPVIGRAADRHGRARLVPAGLVISALSAFLLVPETHLLFTALVVTALSLGYDMTQPLLTGIVTSLDAKRSGQAVGLNVFCLFIGFSLGSLVFSNILFWRGFESAMIGFGLGQLILSFVGIRAFSKETQ